MIHISSKIHGVEVAGIRHPMQTVHYPDDVFTTEQLEEFKASEYLTVELDEPVISPDAEKVDPVTEELDAEKVLKQSKK